MRALALVQAEPTKSPPLIVGETRLFPIVGLTGVLMLHYGEESCRPSYSVIQWCLLFRKALELFHALPPQFKAAIREYDVGLAFPTGQYLGPFMAETLGDTYGFATLASVYNKLGEPLPHGSAEEFFKTIYPQGLVDHSILLRLSDLVSMVGCLHRQERDGSAAFYKFINFAWHRTHLVPARDLA